MRKKIIEVSWIFWAHPLKNIIAPARIQHQPIPTTKHTELRRHRVLFFFISFWRRNFWWNEAHKWKELLFVSYIGNMHISHIYCISHINMFFVSGSEWFSKPGCQDIFWKVLCLLIHEVISNLFSRAEFANSLRPVMVSRHVTITIKNYQNRLEIPNYQWTYMTWYQIDRKKWFGISYLLPQKNNNTTPARKAPRHFEVQCHDLQRLSGALPAQEIRKWCSTSSPQWSYRDHLELLNASEH